MAIALSQIQSPVDDPNALDQSTQPVTKATTLPLAPISTQPATSPVPAPVPTSPTASPTSPVSPTDPSTLPATAPMPTTAAPMPLSSVTPAQPIVTMPYADPTSGSGTVTPPAPVPDAPPAPTDPSTSASGLPAGFTMGDPNSADWGSSYYNGQKVIGNSGGFWQLADGSQGPAYDPATEAAITNAANQAYVGSAGKPGYDYQSMVDPANTYTSPQVRALLQDPEWQAAYDTGPIYADQFSPQTQQLIKAIPDLNTNLAMSGSAPAGYQSFAGIGSGAPAAQTSAPSSAPPTGMRSIAPGAANDVGTPSSGLGSLLAQLGQGGTSGAPGGPATGAGTPSSGIGSLLAQLGLGQGQGGQANNGGATLTPTTAQNALTNQTISPGPATDRFKIAQDQYDAAQQASQPGYEASLRDANRQAFGAGRGVSGQLRTSLGDLAANRATQLDSERRGFLDNALTGSIDDAYKNLGIAQQQQGFQNTQQQEAFSNAIQQALAQEQLISGAYGRAAGNEQAGYANDPSQIALILSQIFGSQASQAGNAASGLFNQQGQNSGGSGSSDALLQYLLSRLGHGGGSPTPADASGQTAGYPGVN